MSTMPRLALSALTAALVGAAGCAPAGAAGQETASPTPEPNVYEVGPEHLRALMAADSQPSTLQVSGSARVSVPTDRVRIDFAVETEAESAREAATENARRMDRVIGELRGSDAPGMEIETHGYRLSPRYVTRTVEGSRVREIDGYTAVNNIRVTVDAPREAGRLIDVAVGAGANRVASLTFEASDPEPARLEALRLAVEKARAEAEAIAAAMGVTLGRPLSVNGGADTPSPPQPMRAMAMEAAQTPVEPGDQTVSASVTITYALVTGGR